MSINAILAFATFTNIKSFRRAAASRANISKCSFHATPVLQFLLFSINLSARAKSHKDNCCFVLKTLCGRVTPVYTGPASCFSYVFLSGNDRSRVNLLLTVCRFSCNKMKSFTEEKGPWGFCSEVECFSDGPVKCAEQSLPGCWVHLHP